MLVKEKLTIDMVAELSHESEKVKKHLENILLISTLKGYSVMETTDFYEFWKNYTISFQKNNENFHIQFCIKDNKIDCVEVFGNQQDFHDTLSSLVGENIKILLTNCFFTYDDEHKLLMLEKFYKFIVSQ